MTALHPKLQHTSSEIYKTFTFPENLHALTCGVGITPFFIRLIVFCYLLLENSFVEQIKPSKKNRTYLILFP